MFVVDQNFPKHYQFGQHLKPWSNHDKISVNSREPIIGNSIYQKPTWCKQHIFAQRVVPAIHLLIETLHYNQRNKIKKKYASLIIVDSTWYASLVLAKSNGYVHKTAVPPAAEPAKRSMTGPVPIDEAKLFNIQHLYCSYVM